MKKSILNCLIIFATVIGIDQLSKIWGNTLPTLHFNEGLMFGMASDLPAALRVVTLSSFFGFIFFAFLLIIYLLPNNLQSLKYSIALFIGGICGNVIDRTFLGRSVDFIPMPFSGDSIFFNLADSFQWIGAAVIIFHVFTRDQMIWPPENQRGKVFINPMEQVRLALKFMAIALCSSLLLGIFAFTFFRTSFAEFGVPDSSDVLIAFGIAFFCLAMLFAMVVFAAGLVISHKTAGPLYAFELYVEDLLKGDRRRLSLREGDNYRHLESIADDLNEYFKAND